MTWAVGDGWEQALQSCVLDAAFSGGAFMRLKLLFPKTAICTASYFPVQK